MKMKTVWYKTFEMQQQKNSSKREVYSNTGLAEEKKPQINNLILHLKVVRKNNQQNPKTAEGEIIKIRAEINV